VQASRPLALKVPLLQRFMAERLECRNISRNSLYRVRRGTRPWAGWPAAIKEERGQAPGFSHSSEAHRELVAWIFARTPRRLVVVRLLGEATENREPLGGGKALTSWSG
jgi:hypothetical protein